MQCNAMQFLVVLRRDELPLYLFDKQCLGWQDEALQQRLADDYQVQSLVCTVAPR